MGILRGLKRRFNVAGSEIAVVFENEIYSQFDLIRGEVVVTAPEYKLAGRAISLGLREFWIENERGLDMGDAKGISGFLTTTTKPGSGSVYRTHVVVALQGAFDFEPASRHRFPFEVGLPKNCRISTSHTGWRLFITLDIPNAIDPTEDVVLEVQPAEDFLLCIPIASCRGVRHACEGINFFIAPKRLMLSSKRWLPNSTIARLYNTETTDEFR